MDYLSRCPPEILNNIIRDEYTVWKPLLGTSKSFNHICKSVLHAREPLKRQFKKWYFLAYLRLTRDIFKKNKSIITEEIIENIPDSIKHPACLELIGLCLEGGYEKYMESFTEKFGHQINPQKNTAVEWIFETILKNDEIEMEVFRFIPAIAKKRLRFDLFRTAIFTLSAPIIQQLVFSRLVKNGFHNDPEVSIKIITESKSKMRICNYASCSYVSKRELFEKILKYIQQKNSKNTQSFETELKPILAKMNPGDTVHCFFIGYFDNIKSVSLSCDIIRKFLDYTHSETLFIGMIKSMVQRELLYNIQVIRKIIMNRKNKIPFLINALCAVEKKDANEIKRELQNSLDSLSIKKRIEFINKINA